jgi:hypothetical protein
MDEQRASIMEHLTGMAEGNVLVRVRDLAEVR